MKSYPGPHTAVWSSIELQMSHHVGIIPIVPKQAIFPFSFAQSHLNYCSLDWGFHENLFQLNENLPIGIIPSNSWMLMNKIFQ